MPTGFLEVSRVGTSPPRLDMILHDRRIRAQEDSHVWTDPTIGVFKWNGC